MSMAVNKFPGREVSCRTFERLFKEWQKNGRSPEALVAGAGCSLEQLRNKHERISWASYRAIMANARTLWDDDDFVRLGRVVMDTPWAKPFTIPARLLYSAKDFYYMMIRPGGGVARQMFSCVDFSQHEEAPRHLIIEMTMQNGYPICREYFLITKGALFTLPNISGLGNAQVEMEEIEGGFRYDVWLPDGGGTLAGLRRMVTAPFTGRAAARELEEAYTLLHARNIELEDENAIRRRMEAERKQLVEDLEAKNVELEQRNSELERFVYTVSHDLKSPLVTIKGFLGHLELDAARGDAERMRQDFAQIHTAADKMGRLLSELLELSRIGRLINEPEDVPLSALVHEAVAMVAGLIEMQGVAVDIQPAMPAVVADRMRLLEVYQNLIENAVKFTGDQQGPRVEIGAARDAHGVRCFVKDNGIGIEPKYHERVFKLFERLDQRIDGTGIGLALVKRIVEVHGGRIWIESDGLGQGTTFWFTLAGVGDGTALEQDDSFTENKD